MKEIAGDLWDFHSKGHFICITTNGAVKTNGDCVMGRGIARQAKIRFPELPHLLGLELKGGGGNRVHPFTEFHLLSFPVKRKWTEMADLKLILSSAHQLRDLIDCSRMWWEDTITEVYLPRPGCGNGGLKWSDVKPVIAPVLDDRFTIVEIQPGV